LDEFLTAYGALIFDARAKKGRLRRIPAAASSVAGGTSTRQIMPRDPSRDAHFGKESRCTSGAVHVMQQGARHGREVMRITNGNGARVPSIPWRTGLSKLISALAD